MLAELLLMCSPTIIFHSLWMAASSPLSLRWNAEIIVGSSRWFFMEVLSASFPGEAGPALESSPCLGDLLVLYTSQSSCGCVNSVKCQPESESWWTRRTEMYICLSAHTAHQRLGRQRGMEDRSNLFLLIWWRCHVLGVLWGDNKNMSALNAHLVILKLGILLNLRRYVAAKNSRFRFKCSCERMSSQRVTSVDFCKQVWGSSTVTSCSFKM